MQVKCLKNIEVIIGGHAISSGDSAITSQLLIPRKISLNDKGRGPPWSIPACKPPIVSLAPRAGLAIPFRKYALNKTKQSKTKHYPNDRNSSNKPLGHVVNGAPRSEWPQDSDRRVKRWDALNMLGQDRGRGWSTINDRQSSHHQKVYARFGGSLLLVGVIILLQKACWTHLCSLPSRNTSRVTSLIAGSVATRAKIWP
jgi:hypothetical protein